MGAALLTAVSQTQWIFPLSALQLTPSKVTSSIPLEKELYDRARGVEFLFRMGVSLGLPCSAMYTAATWFHRFFMRCSMEDYHRQDVAASCIFLATKTEECGRKLRDVAKVFCAKISGNPDIPDDSKELEDAQNAILLTEEALLEALCFDFVVCSPQAELADLLEAREEDPMLEDYAWSIANDSFRTPLCILYPPRITAAACYVLAQYVKEGPQSPPLDVRIASPAPAASLPTPPSHKFASSEASRFAVEYMEFNEVELAGVAEALAIILEFYMAQDIHGQADHLALFSNISPPSSLPHRDTMYRPFAQIGTSQSHGNTASSHPSADHTPTPQSGNSPAKTLSRGWKPVTGDAQP